MERKDTIKLVLLNILVLFGTIFLLQVAQKNTADIYLEYVISTGTSEQALFFTNHFYANLLKTLYGIVPQVSWYGISQYVFMVVSLIIITYLVAKRFPQKTGMSINVILLVTFGVECYYNPEYTKTALLMVMSAFLLLACNAEERDIKKSILGSVWAIIGALVNERVFMVALIAWIIAGTLWMIVERKKIAIHVLMTVALLTAVVCVAGLADNKKTEAFDAEKGVNSEMLVVLYDFGWPEYSLYKAEYEVLNITENMYDSMREGRFVELSWDKIESIAALKLENKYGLRNVLQRDNVMGVLSCAGNYVCVAALLVLLFSNSRKKCIKVLGIVGIFGGCVLGIYYLGLEHCSWIIFAAPFTLSIFTLFITDDMKYDTLKYNVFPFFAVVLYLFYFNSSINHFGELDWKDTKVTWAAQRNENQDIQYIYDLRTFVSHKPVFSSSADIDLEGNIFVVSYLGYLNKPDDEHAFSLSVLNQYSSSSYWCEEGANIYAVSNSVREKEGHALGFVEMSRAESTIIFGVSAQ